MLDRDHWHGREVFGVPLHVLRLLKGRPSVASKGALCKVNASNRHSSAGQVAACITDSPEDSEDVDWARTGKATPSSPELGEIGPRGEVNGA